MVPFHECSSDAQIIRKLIKGILPTRPDSGADSRQIDDNMWELMKRCWTHEPENRPKCKEILQKLELCGLSRQETSEVPDQTLYDSLDFQKEMRGNEDIAIDLVKVEQILNEVSSCRSLMSITSLSTDHPSSKAGGPYTSPH